jgi:DNA-binding LacI/PurR family transcriptional regulator
VTGAVSSHGRPTLEQVAAAAGVSRATVSRVVNGQASVAPGLREVVERAVTELGYVPNRAARSLVTRRTDTLALVTSEPDVRVFGDPFFAGIVRGVSQEAAAADLTLVLLMAQSFPDLVRVERYLRSAPVDGVLLISEHAANDPIPAAMRAAGIPLVIGGRPLDGSAPVAYVDNDNVGGARLAAEHLRGLGRSRVGMLAGPQDMSAGQDRLAGFRAGMAGTFDPDLVEVGDFTQDGGEAAMARLLARAPDLDAVFAASDLIALGALGTLRRAGRRVPDDVAVVGFDDIEAARVADPPLTTVRQQTVLQGRTMTRLFLAMTRPGRTRSAGSGGDDDLPDLPEVTGVDHVVLPVELVVRASA